ncbi:MAG: 4'-phosphopantetheinyl transferase superfamily protein [Deltaproteobacteria bacterium]|nr:4'-phosphopantetheinyl transferase superfamily protein [Deltaproteobacteria bacterium]
MISISPQIEPFPATLSGLARGYAALLPLAAAESESLAQLGIACPESLRKAVAKRQNEFLAGRYCAYRALAQLTPDQLSSIGIGEDYAPVWPKGFVGSITHTRGYVAAAVARAADRCGIGIDVEQVMAQEKATNLCQHILTDEEWRRFENAGAFSVGELVSLVFSAKESVYKCLRPLTGKYFGFQAAELFELSRESGTFKVRLLKSVGGGFEPGWCGSGRFALTSSRVFTAVELVSNAG